MFAVPALCCLLAIVASVFARGHGENVMLPCSVAFTAGWMFYAASWLPCPYAPYCVVLDATGVRVPAPQLWAIADCILATYILTKAGEQWAGLSLFALLVSQNAMHLMYQLGGLDFARYSSYLNGTFACEIAVFLVSGTAGIIEYVADRWCFGDRRGKRDFLVEIRNRRDQSLEADRP